MLRNIVKLLISLGLLLYVAILPAAFCEANGTVSGNYTSSSGKQIVLSLNLNRTGPTNLIVDQHVGRGNAILSTSPSAQKVNNGTGQVKWLFRNVGPGALKLVITLEKPIKGRPQAVVKYKQKGNGGFEELRISP